MAGGPNKLLAHTECSIAEVAHALFEPATVLGVLHRVVDLAVKTIEGCDAAGIFLVEHGQVVTKASTDPIVEELEASQFETGEGPCLDALCERTTLYAQHLAEDRQWPTFAHAAKRVGIRSLIAFPLSMRRPSALILYARLPEAFGASDRAKGVMFASVAGMTLDSAEDREDYEKRAQNLLRALRTRDLIGQAQGILMEREKITADQAFDVLRRASQHRNVKLREVANTVVRTGEAPEPAHRNIASDEREHR